MVTEKKYIDADRLTDRVQCNIEELIQADDFGNANIATIQGAMINALKWVVDLIDAEVEIDTRDSFITDKCKVADMVICTKDESLESYSYLTEKEYNNTFDVLLEMLPFTKDAIAEYEEVMAEREV